MCKQIRYFISVLLCFSIIACQSVNKQSDSENESKPLKIDKNLSIEEQAKNTYQNTTSIFSGLMILAFSDVFDGSLKAFSESLTGNTDSIDAKIKSMDKEISSKIDTIIFSLDKVFDETLSSNQMIYAKLFGKDLMKEGVTITTKYELPEGYRPVSQELTNQEIKRYIIYLLSQPQQTDLKDPIVATFTELTEWLKKVDAEIKSDPEISDFLNNIK